MYRSSVIGGERSSPCAPSIVTRLDPDGAQGHRNFTHRGGLNRCGEARIKSANRGRGRIVEVPRGAVRRDPAPPAGVTQERARSPPMTVLERKAHSQVAHLTPADIEAIGLELDAIRQGVIDSRGERDAAYIRRVIDVQRKMELGSRVVLLASRFPPAWILGTLGLSVAKILDNMEI